MVLIEGCEMPAVSSVAYKNASLQSETDDSKKWTIACAGSIVNAYSVKQPCPEEAV